MTSSSAYQRNTTNAEEKDALTRTTPSQSPAKLPETTQQAELEEMQSVQKDTTRSNNILLSERKKFPVGSLPQDVQRVYQYLEAKYDEDYALKFVFTMRTAMELHRAWHMTLLTSKILQQIKDTFDLKMTWNLGVIRLKFRVDDGGHELHRKVPYDYDSEYQDIYMRIAIALIEGDINVHEALIYQTETKKGLHTADSGLFIRDFPGRLLLYPLEAATCAVIFFSGDWTDAYIAAICGLAAGILEWTLASIGGEAKILIDVIVGFSTGVIGGLFYRHDGPTHCLKAVFLGTLYWFFYGTAFVIGILEIIAGELETGVTRFIAVSVKTFVLSLGAGIGLMVAAERGKAVDYWEESQQNCVDASVLDEKWWRIPLYLLCSASVLGQYRLPIVQYWRGLVVQLCAYEAQYQMFKALSSSYDRDNLDTSFSNIGGAAAAVVSACTLSFFINGLHDVFHDRLLQRNKDQSSILNTVVYYVMACGIHIGTFLRIGRKSDFDKLIMERKIREQMAEVHDPSHSRQFVELSPKDQNLYIETIVGAQEINVWSVLMPALYQLVPGSIIAKLWFNSIFPPPQDQSSMRGQEDVFSNLMVISTSLSLGLIIGFAIVHAMTVITLPMRGCCASANLSKIQKARLNMRASRIAGMCSAPPTGEDDPETEHDESDGKSDGDTSDPHASSKEVKSLYKSVSLDDVHHPVDLIGNVFKDDAQTQKVPFPISMKDSHDSVLESIGAGAVLDEKSEEANTNDGAVTSDGQATTKDSLV